jgi:hypothetical protein
MPLVDPAAVTEASVGPSGDRQASRSRRYQRYVATSITWGCVALLVALAAAPPAQAMPAPQQHATRTMRALDAGGTLTIAWANGSLNAAVSLNGLAANTVTIGYIVPGTCASPGGSATFRTHTMSTDANGNLSAARSNMGTNPNGIILPKAFQVVQNRQIVLCSDTTQDPTYRYTNGRVKSASMTLTFSPASGTAPTG